MVKIFLRVLDMIISLVLPPLVLVWWGISCIEHQEVITNRAGYVIFHGQQSVIFGYVLIAMAVVFFVTCVYFYRIKYPDYMLLKKIK